ncbi:MAG: PLDc N-terminal domain-containing protein [Desulfobacterales bacterium]|nr:PLDc N-terminal domain-containing protein [Desulfobacterales bacterium]
MKTVISVIALSVPFFILTVWAVVDAALKDFGTPGKKVLWLIVAATPYLGCLLYFAIGFRKGKKTG